MAVKAVDDGLYLWRDITLTLLRWVRENDETKIAARRGFIPVYKTRSTVAEEQIYEMADTADDVLYRRNLAEKWCGQDLSQAFDQIRADYCNSPAAIVSFNKLQDLLKDCPATMRLMLLEGIAPLLLTPMMKRLPKEERDRMPLLNEMQGDRTLYKRSPGSVLHDQCAESDREFDERIRLEYEELLRTREAERAARAAEEAKRQKKAAVKKVAAKKAAVKKPVMKVMK